MKQDAALYLVRTMLARYKDGPVSRWHPKGQYVPQWLIGKASRGMVSAVERMMAGRRQKTLRTIRIDRIYSDQRSLTHRRLIRAVRYRRKMPPIDVFEWLGRYYLWNGNHRLTADILLGRETVRAWVYSPPIQKRTTKRQMSRKRITRKRK